MGAFFTAVLGKIVSLATWIGTLAVAVFAAAWFLGTDLGCWFVESLLDVVISVLNSFQVDFELFNPASYISALPPEIVNIFGLLRVGEGIAIIASACTLKIALQLIPFTRLGS